MMRMRPHTRTQCADGNQCSECRGSTEDVSGNSSSFVVSANAAASTATSASNSLTNGASSSNSNDHFVAPSSTTVVTRRSSNPASKAFDANGNRAVIFVELPAELLVKILNYMSFKEISQVRLVSRRFNEICASMLNSTFQRLQNHMLQRFQAIKSQMPRRESARRNHPLALEIDIVETLHMRLTLLQMTLGKHIERKHICFFAGEILDEVQRIMRYIRQAPGRTYKAADYGMSTMAIVTDELFDLSTMAMEYFKEHIEPTLPEITYFGAEFLDFTSFATPTKRRSQSGSTSILGNTGLDSPCSSRASVAGSCVSEPWSTASTASTVDPGDVETTSVPVVVPQPPQSNMVLRKRIRRIRQGMKRYNDQLVEVKRELKTCKTKMDTQSKQVQEYSQRLEDYDKKFEESSRKFQTLLTELNKCKTELQYWRSKSTTLLSLPTTCASCQAPLLPQPESLEAADAASKELKALANQGVFLTEEDIAISMDDLDKPGPSTSGPPSPSTRAGNSTLKSGPPSPASATGRKRRSRDDLALEDDGDTTTRKSSLRGSVGGKSTRVKRPKVAANN